MIPSRPIFIALLFGAFAGVSSAYAYALGRQLGYRDGYASGFGEGAHSRPARLFFATTPVEEMVH